MTTESSLENSELYAALVSFQSEVPSVEKKRTAQVTTKSGSTYEYSYADLADIWAAIREPLKKNDLAVLQPLSGGNSGEVILTTIVAHKSGQKLISELPISIAGKNAQEQGSLFTYMKRYTLGAVLGIATEEDDDGVAGNQVQRAAKSGSSRGATLPPKASAKRVASQGQLKLIGKLAGEAGYDDAWVANALMKVNTSADASTLIDKLRQSTAGVDHG
ncbi:ERF family protein [Tsukamurella spumae]|uniref:ERF family protein n=1 Tax=Tsukamurella spumae TaxID=44753 RepID=A0A846X0V3_9ACTN|nr:ERF family protein [Tsukamurella spumae]NKY18884.1 ERF family protein [Tsukamurella spumae]